MNVTVFGGLNRRPLPPGWTKETMIVVFGGGELDLSASPPGPDACLTVVAILGGLEISVAAGTRVSVGGFGLFGGRKVEVSQVGDGSSAQDEPLGDPRRCRRQGTRASIRGQRRRKSRVGSMPQPGAEIVVAARHRRSRGILARAGA